MPPPMHVPFAEKLIVLRFYVFVKMLIGLTQQTSEFVIASP